jgi:hypothetical protein
MNDEPLTVPTVPQLRSRLAELTREQRMLRGLLRVIERKQGDDQIARQNAQSIMQEGGRRAS